MQRIDRAMGNARVMPEPSYDAVCRALNGLEQGLIDDARHISSNVACTVEAARQAASRTAAEPPARAGTPLGTAQLTRCDFSQMCSNDSNKQPTTTSANVREDTDDEGQNDGTSWRCRKPWRGE